MARRSKPFAPDLTQKELIGGFCYLPFYMVLLSLIFEFINTKLGLGLSALQINTCFFVSNAVVIWVVFHRFLMGSLRSIRLWELVQAVILGYALYFVGQMILTVVTTKLAIDIPHYNNDSVASLMEENRILVAIYSIVVAPIVEETLMRGLVFGTARKINRVMGYVISIVLFSSIHVWQFLFLHDWKSVLLAAVVYVPPSVALAWTYEKANNIWAPITLHAALNAMALGFMNLQ